MPSIKRSGVKSREVKTGFEAYDGPEPNKRAVYRSKIAQFNYKQFRSGATGYAIMLELEAQSGDPKGHAQYDGYPIWTNVVFGDKEAMINKENNLYAALGVKDEPNVVFEEGELENGVKVKTIGGKNPIGAIVNADIKIGSYEGSPRPEVDSIFKVRDINANVAKAVSAPPEEDEPEDEEVEGDEVDYDARLKELKGASISDLRTIAESDYDLEIKGLKKLDLVQAILDEEFPPEDEEEAEDEAEEDEEEDDEEDDDEEEEDDEDERAEREAELSGLTRIQLKSAIRKVDPDFTVKKSHTEEDLIAAILDAEFGPEDEDEETPF